MWWMDPNKQLVALIADTSDEGPNLEIGTTYSDESIIWEALQAFPVEQIEPYTEPVVTE